MKLTGCLIAIAVVIALAYRQVVNFGIVNLDDYSYVVDNAQNFGLLWSLQWMGDGMWTPLTWLSYWFDRVAFGESWGCYHIHNVALHIGSSTLLYLIIRSLNNRIGQVKHGNTVAFFLALLWALHPLRVESVAWLSSRKDCLSTLFFMAAVLTWINASRARDYILCFAFLVLGGCAKSSVMIFPVFALSIDAFVLRRKRPYWCYGLLLTYVCSIAGLAAFAQDQGGATVFTQVFCLPYRIVNALYSQTVYAYNVIMPTSLAPQCIMRLPDAPRFSFFGLGVLAVGLWYVLSSAKRMYQQKRLSIDPVLCGLVCYFVSFAPFAGIAAFGFHAYADRFTILPSIGLIICLWGAYFRFSACKIAPYCLVVSASISVLLFNQTVKQVKYWENDKTLFSRLLEVDGDNNFVAHKNLAIYYYEYPHDYGKVYEHLLYCLRAPEWQREHLLCNGPMFVEAACELGRMNEALSFIDMMHDWARLLAHATGNDLIVNYELANLIRIAYNPNSLEYVEKELAKFERMYPDDYMVKNVRYIVERRKGNPADIEAARRRAYAPNTAQKQATNRWALQDQDNRRAN